ncbi:SPOSA6832_03684, partial [Sporobolomyces salmonicolor]
MVLSRAPGWRTPKRHQLLLAVVVVVALHLLVYRSTAPLRTLHSASLSRRAFDPLDHHDRDRDPESEAFIDWLAWYRHTPRPHRPALFAAMGLWLVFLFAFVGICASEFFCPNLSHIASRLGLSESVAGVTFLAFSNGSPDVFSTFAALRSGSGSLAIGELIGAASFIVSVVAGSMALITPFRVSARTFLRDVGFFTLAVLLTLGILWDSHLHLWEALLMVGLYVVYVLYVGIGSWWENRKEEKRRRLREARDEYDHAGLVDEGEVVEDEVEWDPEEETDVFPSGFATPVSPGARSYRSPSPAFSSDSIIYHPVSGPSTPTGLAPSSYPSHASPHPGHGHGRSRSSSLVTGRPPPTPLGLTRRRSRSVRPSLLGAIEFRDVVNSLSSDRGSAANVLAVFGGAHQHHPHSQHVLEETEGEVHRDGEWQTWVEEGRGLGLGLGEGGMVGGRRRALSQPPAVPGGLRLEGGEETLADEVLLAADARRRGAGAAVGEPTPPGEGLVDLSEGVENPWKEARSSFSSRPTPLSGDHGEEGTSEQTVRRVPSILLTTANGSDVAVPPPDSPPADPSLLPPSIVGKATAILCVPALLMLNLTLPVAEEVSDDDASEWAAAEKVGRSPSGRIELGSDDGEHSEDGASQVSAEDPSSRVGRILHSPAVAHHPHSHHLQNVSEHPADDITAAPSPWATHPSTTPLHSPLQDRPVDYFKVANESEGSVNRVISSEEGSPDLGEEEEEEMEEIVAAEKVTRWLTATQCLLGPLFCVCCLFADDLRWYYLLSALCVGLVFATLAYRFFHNPRHPGRVTLCFLGFAIAMVWILMIVNEVVGVLQTFGHIFGISDAILGLTIFAMGNSLGDLVANATVARMGYPSMAIAACFGGPMLNILLGVGLSGTYLIALSPTHEPIHVDMGRTLLVSCVGLFAILLGSLVVIPLNGYRMSKGVGAALIAAYNIVLFINVAVEIWL